MPAFYKCYFHAVWAVKHRAPLLMPPIEQAIVAAITNRCKTSKCFLFAVNSVSDHIHVAIEIPPSLAPAAVIGALKGASSHELNDMRLIDEPFHWQDGYGLLTFGPRALDFVVRYIERQKERHEMGELIPGLEKTEQE